MEENGIDLSRLSKWIQGFATVRFDIDEGQVIDRIFPSNFLNTSESQVLSSISFPDSNSVSGEESSMKFLIRLKTELNDKKEFSYGYVYFKQEKDPKNARGFKQQSLILVSRHPFLKFFFKVVNILASFYFDGKMHEDIIEEACRNISKWSAPRTGRISELPFLGKLLNVTKEMI